MLIFKKKKKVFPGTSTACHTVLIQIRADLFPVLDPNGLQRLSTCNKKLSLAAKELIYNLIIYNQWTLDSKHIP